MTTTRAPAASTRGELAGQRLTGQLTELVRRHRQRLDHDHAVEPVAHEQVGVRARPHPAVDVTFAARRVDRDRRHDPGDRARRGDGPLERHGVGAGPGGPKAGRTRRGDDAAGRTRATWRRGARPRGAASRASSVRVVCRSDIVPTSRATSSVTGPEPVHRTNTSASSWKSRLAITVAASPAASSAGSCCSFSRSSTGAPPARRDPTTDPAEVPTTAAAAATGSTPPAASPATTPTSHEMPSTPPPPNTTP